MNKSTLWRRVGDFIVGKGFYIVLFLCVATIGISGYYLVSAFNQGDHPDQPVAGKAQVVIPDDQSRLPSGPEQNDPAPIQPEVPPAKADHDPAAQPDERPSSAQITQSQPAVEAPPVYTWPVRGEVVSSFTLEVLAYDETMGDWRTHSGVDISAAEGTRVLAMSDGRVTRVYDDDLMGTTVVIQHREGLESRYHNLSARPAVAEGDEVVTGTVIGAVGSTAIAESGRPPHLHLEVTLNGAAVDPVEYLPQY